MSIPLSSRIRHAVDNGRIFGTVWVFETERFCVSLEIEPVDGYRYDGDDEDGTTQAALDSGEYVAFDSRVLIELDGEEIAFNSLGGSVYAREDVADFWRAHRDADPMNRNSSLMRAVHGDNVCISHYFPDMVREAIRSARAYIRAASPLPYIRPKAA